ncbi:Hypothetical protein D9617_3g020940 [Elsinoe fawcettii]|nr:Hypothetical protein D9617_3g020940 [Elsinoe fawcettii]
MDVPQHNADSGILPIRTLKRSPRARPICFFHLPCHVRSQIYQLVFSIFPRTSQTFYDARQYNRKPFKVKTTFLNEHPLFCTPEVLRLDHRLAFASIRPHFQPHRRFVNDSKKRNAKRRDARVHFTPDYFDFLEEPRQGNPPVELPYIRFWGFDETVFLDIDVSRDSAGVVEVSYDHFDPGLADIPIWQEMQAQLCSVAWPAVLETALMEICDSLAQSIIARDGHGMTVVELRMLVDLNIRIAHVMHDYHRLAIRMEKQAKRKPGYKKQATSRQLEAPHPTTNNPQSIRFFDLPLEVRQSIYADMPLNATPTEIRYDGFKLKSLHYFQPPSLLRLPEVHGSDSIYMFDDWRMVIYLFSLEHLFRYPALPHLRKFNHRLDPWSLRRLLGDETVNWLRGRPGEQTIEFKHFRIRGPNQLAFDIDVLQQARVVQIRDVYEVVKREFEVVESWRICPREESKIRSLSKRLELSIAKRKGTGICSLEMLIITDEMRRLMICRRYAGVWNDTMGICSASRWE